MRTVLIKNAQIVNEGTITSGDVLIEADRIAEIAPSISVKNADTKVIDADGFYLIPGMIDDQVHFREPGLTHKATIKTESRAAVAGGITSFIEMPNTVPQATTIDLLEGNIKKFDKQEEYIHSHARSTIFHSIRYANIIRREYGISSYLVTFIKHNEICGLIILYNCPIFPFGEKLTDLIFSGSYGGILCNEDILSIDLIEQLRLKFNKLLGEVVPIPTFPLELINI